MSSHLENKIVIETMGRTYLLPTTALFTFNNAQLEIYAPNFKIVIDKRDMQEIYLLVPEFASPIEKALLEKLPHVGTKQQETLQTSKESPEPLKITHQQTGKDPEEKKDIELRSGMI